MIGRTVAGATLAVLFAWIALPVAIGLRPGQSNAAETAVMVFVFCLPVIAICAGPPALLLAALHSALLARFARRGHTLRRIRRVGILLGMPLGVANLCIVFGCFGAITSDAVRMTGSEWMPFVVAALAGGAGLGWGASFGIRPGPAPIPRPAFRVRPTQPLRRRP